MPSRRCYLPLLLLICFISTPLFAQTFGVYRELWTGLNMPANDLQYLTNSAYNSHWPNSPDSSIVYTNFETESNTGVNNYGQRLRAFIIPPTNGNYIFWLASDDTSQLFISRDENPATKYQIAWVNAWTGARQWDSEPNQQSVNIPLQAGHRYYIEAIMQQGGGGDDFGVRWQWPDGTFEETIPAIGSTGPRLIPCTSRVVSPGVYLGPTNVSVIEGSSATFSVLVTNQSPVTYQWCVNGTNLSDAAAFTPIYTVSSVPFESSGQAYTCIIADSAGSITSSPAILTVNHDLTPPVVTRVMNVGTTNVQLTFSKTVEAASATNTANYAFTNGMAVTQAALSADQFSVMLTTAPLVFGSNYTLVVNGVRDCAVIPNTIATNTMAPFQALLYASQDVGNPSTPSSTAILTNGLDVVGSGTDIGGYSDQFAFSYQLRTGDFDISGRVPLFNSTDIWSKAGLMARESLLTTSRFAATLATPAMGGVCFEYRDPSGAKAQSTGAFPVNYPSTWLRLKRAGNTFSSYASYDGKTWTQLGSVTITMASQLYVGVAVSSHSAQPAQAQFRDLTYRTDAPVLGTAANPHEPLGPSSRKTPIAISEIMYKPAPRADGNNLEFLEIYNSNPYFHDISGYQLLTETMSYTFPQGTIIQAGTFLVIAASPQSIQNIYGITNVVGPYSGSLKKSGTVQLLDEVGAVLLTVPYSNLNPWPVGTDGTGHSLVLAKPTYGEGDPRAWDTSDLAGGSPGTMEAFVPNPLRNVVINELLANSTNPAVPTFVELYNHSTQTNDLSGCILTDDANVYKFVIPAGTVIAPTNFVSFTASQLGFSLSPAGGTVYFLSPDASQILNAVQYEAQADGISLGRSPEGANAFYAMTAPTPSAPNSPIFIGDIVINELMYDPISGNDDDQYIELYNKGTNTISLANWQFTSGVTFTFPTNAVLAPDSYLVVARNQANLFAKYPNLNITNTVGNFGGKLSHSGERVALAMSQQLIVNGATNTIYAVEDEVTYGSGGRWGQWSAGGGSSLELIDPRSNHRLAANWSDSDKTQKSVWTNIETTGVLDNGQNYDSSIDFAQIGILDVGECLVDNLEVLPGTTGANYVSNPTFENGSANWNFEGCHSRSSLENTGYNSAHSLHLRSSDRFWTGVNSCEVSLNNTTLQSGQTATLRFKARWLHGCPEVIMRLGGNWLEATGSMPIPANLGTPGAPNSRYATNAGPAISEVTHTPAVPAAGQPVVVTARVHDSDGLLSLTLCYRIDPWSSYTAVTMKDDGTGGDAVAGDGIYSATIPGYGANVVVPFFITAKDQNNVATRFPALLNDNAPTRECLVMFGDGNPTGIFGVYHLWISQTNATRWANLSDLSNEAHDCTIVNGNRVIYNAQARFAGSPYHQGFNTPYGNLCHYKWIFPDDDKFLGATSFNKIHQPGNGAGDDQSQQREQVANMLLRGVGVPWLNRRHVIVYVNGNRRGQLMEDAQTPDSDIVEEHYPNDKDGFLFKMQPWFEFAYVAPQTVLPSSVSFNNFGWVSVMPFTTTGGAHKTARYRYNFMMRRTPDSNSNYTNVFALSDAASTYGTPNYVANMESIANMENWMRVFAANHAGGNWDSFGAQNGQNLYGYIGTQGTKYSLHMFDFNISIGNGGSWNPGENLFVVNGADPNMANIYNEPTFRRMYWRALQELCNGPLNVANSGPLIDAKYKAMTGSGLVVENTVAIKNWLTAARTSILSQLAGENTSTFTITQVQTVNNAYTITGTAPVQVKDISINGVVLPVTWTSVTKWKITVPLGAGTNVFNIAGIDIHGNPISGTSNTVSVIYNGTAPSPAGNVVINEIMYNPSVPGAQYVEFYNNSTTQTFDLSNWQVRELSYVFPPGSSIGPKGFLVLAANRLAFASAYGVNVPVFDTFSSALPNDATTLTLVQPATSGTNDLLVARVKYENALPWSTNAPGTSLQLIDPRQDNWRVANWGVPQSSTAQWVYVTAKGTGSSSTLYIYLQSAGDVYVDDMKLVAGSVPESGANLLANGDFESTFPGPWIVSANLSGSAISTAVKHSGNASLHVVSSVAGTTQGSSIWQTTSTALQSSTTYTLSFWYLQSTNGGPLTVRLSGSGIVATVSPAPATLNAATATPGAVNSVSNALATFQPLWINELQADNVSGITSRAGQHVPWIELYNPSTNTVSLNGLYLANNYTNLTAWPFPTQATMQPGEFKVIFADGQTNLSTLAELHTSFSLSSGPGQLALSRMAGTTQVLDYVNYTNVEPDHSYGSFPDGQSFQRQQFFYPTPGATNNGFGALPSVCINEWMAGNKATIANPIGGEFDDWFELYNYGTTTVDLAGYYLTSELEDKFMFLIPPGYAIPAKGYLLVWADRKMPTGSGDLHVDFKLSKSGTSIGLFRADGAVIDSISFGPQVSDISQGRYPDASTNIISLALATPRAPNYVLNTAPVLSPIPDVTLILGQTLAFTASAIDSDQPVQTLSFTLELGAPVGAQIDSASGRFSWTPASPATNTIGIVVNDSGTPPLSATQRFTVRIIPLPKLAARASSSQVTFNWQTVVGQSYQIEYKNDLGSTAPWTPLGNTLVGDGNGAELNIPVDTATQRFYRLRITH